MGCRHRAPHTRDVETALARSDRARPLGDGRGARGRGARRSGRIILVTGGTGFLGHHLIPALRQAGYPVKALVRSTSEIGFLRSCNVETAAGDLLDRDSLVEAMQGCRYVIHAGGLFRLWGEQQAFEETNVRGTAHILEAALRAG